MDNDRYACEVYKMMIHDKNCCYWAIKINEMFLILMMCGKQSWGQFRN